MFIAKLGSDGASFFDSKFISSDDRIFYFENRERICNAEVIAQISAILTIAKFAPAIVECTEN